MVDEWMSLFKQAAATDAFSGTVSAAALVIAFYLTATTLSMRWVWANA